MKSTHGGILLLVLLLTGRRSGPVSTRDRSSRRAGLHAEAGFESRRARMVLQVLGGLCVVLVLRAAQMHLLHGEVYLKKASASILGHVEIERRRVRIADRNGEPVAVSLRASALRAYPKELKHPEAAAELLAPLLPQTRSEVLTALRSGEVSVYVAHELNDQVAESIRRLMEDSEIKERQYLAGLRLVPDLKRLYPKGEVAAQILGWTGHGGRYLAGLERGVSERFVEWRDSRSLWVEVLRTGRGREKPGSSVALMKEVLPHLREGTPTVHTTLDLRLQSRAERILVDEVGHFSADRGLAIVLDVRTGEILAFAHVPRIDANTWYFEEKEHRIPWGILEAYEPGSVMKVFTVAAALDHGLVTPSTVIDTHGGRLSVFGHRIDDLKRMAEATLTEVIRYSSNIGAYEVAKLLGQEALEAFLRKAGFGRATGLPIADETAGIFSRPESGWDEVKFANIAFGQGIAVSAIQLVSAFAAFGNDGVLMRPRLLKALVAESGEVLHSTKPKALGSLVRPETATTVRRMLAAVVEPGGTGSRARLRDCAVGGKTGTGQQYVEDPETGRFGYSSSAEMASFAGLVPIDDPRLAIYVMLDRPSGGRGGGEAAAPAFARIAEASLDLLGRRPCSQRLLASRSFSRAAPRAAEGGGSLLPPAPGAPAPMPDTVVAPDLEGRGLAESVEALIADGFHPQVRGAGVVRAQEPPGGTPVPEGATIQLHCSLSAEAFDVSR